MKSSALCCFVLIEQNLASRVRCLDALSTRVLNVERLKGITVLLRVRAYQGRVTAIYFIFH